jgi:hypothetical protein
MRYVFFKRILNVLTLLDQGKKEPIPPVGSCSKQTFRLQSTYHVAKAAVQSVKIEQK